MFTPERKKTNGNRPVPALQRKPLINKPGDAQEQEADLVSGSIADGVAPVPAVNRARAASEPMEVETPGIVTDVLKEPGSPLDAGVRGFMEDRFGHAFGNVRVHNTDKAMQSANAINARAYTAGNNIVFGRNQYAPGTADGRRLLAHELTHVVQQSPGGSGPRIARQPAAPPPPAATPPAPSPIELPRDGIEMPWVGKGGTTSSELGYLRDPQYFWTRFKDRFPAAVSADNLTRIAGNRSPVVDAQWVSVYPQHKGFMGQTLEHHHVGQGAKAVPIPSGLHDAYTVFHPQRRVVGTPQGGVKPLPPQPTRQQSQAEINRHAGAGRLGPGVTPGSIQAPAIPPASVLAGEDNPQRLPPRAAAPQPNISRAAAAHVGGSLVAAVAAPVISYYLQQYYAPKIEAAARDAINKELEKSNEAFKGLVLFNEPLINLMLDQGKRVHLYVVVMQGWTDTTDNDPIAGSGISIGRVPYVTKVEHLQIEYEGVKPAPFVPNEPGGAVGGALRQLLGTSLQYHHFRFPIERPKTPPKQ